MSSASEEETSAGAGTSTKKRRKFGTVKDACKKLRNMTNETGRDCNCKRYQCFQNIIASERAILIRDFNALADRNVQNSYLAGLITLGPVQRRRFRKGEETSTSFHNYSYEYKVRVVREGKIFE